MENDLVEKINEESANGSEGMSEKLLARIGEMEAQTKPKTWADMDDVYKSIKWEWPKWLPKGFLVLVVSDSGQGKSNLILHICASILRGDPFPDGSPYNGDQGCIQWVETEAAEQLNWERATDWGLPKDRIYRPFNDDETEARLDSDVHRKAIKSIALRDDVKLTVVDSFSSSHRRKENSEDAGEISKWLAGLARDTQKIVLVSHHLNKPGKETKGEITLDRVRGHSRIVQTTRVVWAIDAPNPNDKDHKRLSVIKNNLGKIPDPIGFYITDEGIKFVDAPNIPKAETQLDKACDILLALLSKGPVLSSKIEEDLKGAGISFATVKRAKERLQIIARRDGERWYWGLPYK
jgi:putative DNA primase/helicase